jgi:hypothetical protein
VKLTPHSRRDWFVENHVKTAKALGLTVDVEAVQRQAAKDLAAAEQVPTQTKAPAPNQKREKERSNVVKDAARARKAKVYERAADSDKRVLPVLTGVDEERRVALFARIKRICTPIPERLNAATLANGVGGMCEAPALANDVALHTYGYARGATIHPTTGITSYKGLSFEDRIRKYTRALEDICDRSTGLYGPWWVK